VATKAAAPPNNNTRTNKTFDMRASAVGKASRSRAERGISAALKKTTVAHRAFGAERLERTENRRQPPESVPASSATKNRWCAAQPLAQVRVFTAVAPWLRRR
jgi:hypothetical protein